MWGAAVGVLLMATGVVLVAVGSRSLDAAAERRVAVLQEAFVTSPESPHVTQFERAAAFGVAMDEPIVMSFFLFNLTNSGNVVSGRARPQVSEIGPYTYEKTVRKVNVTFHSTLPGSSSTSPDYAYVSYGLETAYTFVPQRSNGSESDVVVTLNATYARTLAKYRQVRYSERLMVADFAHRHLQSYHRHLREEFIAQTKQRALQFFLPYVLDEVRKESVAPAIRHQRERVDSASISRNLVQMYAVARQEVIPQVLTDVMKDVSDKYVPEILQAQLEAARDHALPRVMSNLLNRMKVEAIPVLLEQQINAQYLRQVPKTLNSLYRKLPQLAFPYVVQELFDRACLDAVPSILRTIKLEIIARDIAANRVQADIAQNNVIETWRKRASTTPVDFDGWIDDNPSGQPRAGFELRPLSATLEISKEVATLLLGSKSSNKRFSVVDYDAQSAASYALDNPTETPVGFGIWKQVIAMNETAITYLISSVNYDVALPSDYITRAQVLFIRDYLIQWAQRDVIKRDRERFWRQNYAKRTSNSDTNEPAVDLDIEQTGIQTGFNLQASGASTSGVTPSISRQVWDGTNPFSFVNVQGFTIWYEAAVLGSQTALQSLTRNIAGLNSNQFTEISTWMKALLQDGFLLRRALRHWSDGTCVSPMKLPLSSCLIYDLEPHISGIQGGFEMNPSADSLIQVSRALREEFWNQAKPISFLNQVLASDFTTGYGLWLQALRTDSVVSVVNAVIATSPSFTSNTATAIITWLRLFSANRIHTLNILNWWRSSTCLPRKTVSLQQGTSSTTSGASSCSKAYTEVEKNSVVTVAAADQSPFSTRQRQLDVSQTDCVFDDATSKYTKTDSTYQLTTEEYSCDVLSTELSDDHANDDLKSGFELGPLLTTSQVASRPSLAATSSLWDPSNPFSFRHFTGYKRWVYDYTTNTATRAQLMTDINARVTTECSKITVAGTRSAVFNVTLIGSDASCGQVTLDQVDVIQKWVSGLGQSAWVESALLDQWRRGSTDAPLDIEPYRPLKQTGLELAVRCKCSLTTAKGTVYRIPRIALGLWDAKSSVSFLTSQGYAPWASLLNASAYNDAVGITYWKTHIQTATSLSTWEDWLDNIASWLTAWRTNEHLMRDVLGHWLHGTCATSPTIISITSESSPTTTTVSSCPPIGDRYKVVLNDTLDDILATASRPSFANYFDPEVVEKSAFIKLKKIVEVSETWTDCETLSTSQFKQVVSTRVSIKEYTSCSLLNVLSTGTTAAVPITQSEVTFELNRTAESSSVSIEIALAAWDNDDKNPWGFTNAAHFLSLWQPAIHRSEAREALQTSINAAIPSTTASDLVDVTAYLNQWETSSKSTRRVGEAWLLASGPFLDLDTALDGRQVGFELMTSFAWRKIAGTSPSSLPTIDQAQYLWDPKKAYSFLNRDTTITDRFPVGFSAWRELYEGLDPSSEHLLWVYPEVATTQRSPMTAKLTESDREQLLWLLTNETSLAETQVRGIAAWVIGWSDNNVLQDYFLQLWATNVTPRGEIGMAVDMAHSLPFRFDKLLDELSIPGDPFTSDAKSTLGTVSKLTLRALWDVKQVGSLLNPAGRDVWCLLDLPILRVCPHVLTDLGVVSETALHSFISTVKSVLVDVGTITRSSNLHNLALSYLKQQFGITQDQVLATAKWWRSLPTSSSYFQVLQVNRWLNMSDELAAIDPSRLGFGLGSVFSSKDTKVNRRATAEDLVANPRQCTTMPLSLAVALWNRDSPSSFVSENGMTIWHDYAHQDSPRKSSAFLTLINNRDIKLGTVISQLDPAVATCTIDTIANWVLSWEVHPITSQFVENLWYQEPTSFTSPLRFYSSPSKLVQAFPSANTPVSGSTFSSPTIEAQAKVAELVFDSSEAASMGNLTHGFPVWRALLSNCTTTEVSTGKCKRSLNESVESDAALALKMLTSALHKRLVDVYPSEPVPLNAVEEVVLLRLIPWLIYWLDSPLLLNYIVKHAIEVDAFLKNNAGSLSYNDFPAVQFVSAAFTRINYSVAIDAKEIEGFTEHYGVSSERITRNVLQFDSETQVVKPTNVTGQTGFAELRAYCECNAHDRVFAYDTATTCSLDVSYQVAMDVAKQFLTTFADDEQVYTIQISETGELLQLQRASLLIDAFLAQPFSDAVECTYLVDRLTDAYGIPPSEQKKACKSTADGILLDLTILSTAGLSVASVHRIQDFQAYLRYAATKFIYEPSVLGLEPTPLWQEDILQSPPTLLSSADYPVGGLITKQTVAQALSPSNMKRSLWQTKDLTSPPITFTFLIPSRPDIELVSKTTQRSLGQIVLINASPTISVRGVSASLSSAYATDGSQFTTAILTGRRNAESSGTTAFPPPKLLFFWDYSSRMAQASYVKNTTRFGIPLMRYTIDDWQEPSNFPSGVDAMTVSDTDAPAHSINVTTHLDGLPMLLSSAPLTADSKAKLTPNRDTAIDVDPVTGVVYHRRLTWQLTAHIRAADTSCDYYHKKLQQGWLPVLWIREQRSVSSTSAAAFLAKTSKPGPFAPEKLAIWGVVGGCVYVLVGAAVSYTYVRRARMVRLRKLQSVMPATTSTIAVSTPPKPISSRSQVSSVSTHVHETSGIEVPPPDATPSSVTPWVRKRTTPRIESIKEVQEDHSDVQQL